MDQFAAIPEYPVKEFLIQAQICNFSLKFGGELFLGLEFLHDIKFQACKESRELGEIPQHPLHIKNIEITHEVSFSVKPFKELVNLLTV